MAHLVIISTPRSGSHMIRSMLERDPRCMNIGGVRYWEESKSSEFCERPDDADYLTGFLGRRIAEAESTGRVMVGGIVSGEAEQVVPVFEAVRRCGIAVLHLHRRDLLAQIASWKMAGYFDARVIPAPKDAAFSVDPDDVLTLGQAVVKVNAMVGQQADASIAYEDLTPNELWGVLVSLGVHLMPGEALTPVIRPGPAESYVTNYAEMGAAFHKAGLL